MSLLSVIVPCYNEEESVALFYQELTKNDPFFKEKEIELELLYICLLYTSPSPRDS